MKPETRVTMNPFEVKSGNLDANNRLIMIETSRHVKAELFSQLQHWLHLQQKGQPFRFLDAIKKLKAGVKPAKSRQFRKKTTAGKQRARDPSDSEESGELFQLPSDEEEDSTTTEDDQSLAVDGLNKNDQNKKGQNTENTAARQRPHPRRPVPQTSTLNPSLKNSHNRDDDRSADRIDPSIGDGISTAGDAAEVEGALNINNAADQHMALGAIDTDNSEHEQFSLDGHFSIRDIPPTARNRYKALKTFWAEQEYQDTVEIYRECWVCYFYHR